MICPDCGKQTEHSIKEDLCDMCICKQLGIEVNSEDEAGEILDKMGEVEYMIEGLVCSRIPAR